MKRTIVQIFGVILMICLVSFEIMPLKESFFGRKPIEISIANGNRTNIDISKSVIRWRGTKMLGTGEHEGILKFRSGHIESRDGQIVGGTFIADMNSIGITDIPPEDHEPIKNLTDHLKSDFETSEYPEALFKIGNSKSQEICGHLTIKATTKPLCFELKKLDEHFTTSFVISRSVYGIGEKGSWLEKKLVDDEIYLTIDVWPAR